MVSLAVSSGACYFVLDRPYFCVRFKYIVRGMIVTVGVVVNTCFDSNHTQLWRRSASPMLRIL